MENKGQHLWNTKAVRFIPGGNGLLSKRPDRYLPGIWPVYFSEAKGVEVTDLEGNTYIDMAQMGIGTAILGYADPDVNLAVKQSIDQGINTTLNACEEVFLAEKLIELSPGMGGVRFARTGGEAMALAVRIARAYSGRDNIAFSGYHGWHDWYLATNLGNSENLSDHLLPGLNPLGVPKGLSKTIFPFQYNKLDELELIIKQENIGVIVIEGARYQFPSQEFLTGIQDLAKTYNIVIIVDEITSGWRLTDGGTYKLFNFSPDLVVYGKGLGNGFAISAVVGKKNVMDIAQDTFASSTFWTERVGFVAALATIDKFCSNQVWKHLIHIGTEIGEGWKLSAQKYGLNMSITEYKPLITFKFNYKEVNNVLYTLFTQEMLKKGYLASNSVYVSYAHTSAIVSTYLEVADSVFRFIAEALKTEEILKKLDGPVREDGFKRLNE